MSTKITQRQQLVLDVDKGFQTNGMGWPSIKDIRDHLGLKSDNGVLKHLNALEKKGYLIRPRNESGKRKHRLMILLK